jgi:MarR family transcriptional regulator, organic hydroperoxide resistance regulator
VNGVPAVARPSSPADADRVLQFMRLIWAVDHELERCSKRMEMTHGLTVGQRMTLLMIHRNPDASATALALLMHVHPGTMSGMLKRLETAGFITRRGHLADARRYVLSLTPKGVAANRRRDGTFESAASDLLQAHSVNDIAAAERVLGSLSARLRAGASPGTPGTLKSAATITSGEARSNTSPRRQSPAMPARPRAGDNTVLSATNPRSPQRRQSQTAAPLRRRR